MRNANHLDKKQTILPSPIRWGGAWALIFSVPYTDLEILALLKDDKMMGVIFNPQVLSKPLPWLSTCPHCRREKQQKYPTDEKCRIKARRAIQTLCTIKPERPDGYRFTLPNHHQLHTRRNARDWVMGVRKPGSRSTLWVKKLAGEEPIFEGPVREFRSPVLLRTLRLFFSAREPGENEIQTSLLPLLKQDPSSLKPSQRTPCRLITHP
jgi:hypothetical protein